MINIFLIFLAITDPDKVLQRLQNTMTDYLKELESLTNNQAIISDHQEMSHFTRRFQNIKKTVDFLIFDMS